MVGGGWRGRAAVGRRSDTGRRVIPGRTSSRPEWPLWFTLVQIHQTFLLFKQHIFVLSCDETQRVCVQCVSLVQSPLAKNLFVLFLFLVKVDFRRASLVRVFFFPALVMSAAHDRAGFGPIFVYQADSADFFAPFQFFNYVSSGG